MPRAHRCCVAGSLTRLVLLVEVDRDVASLDLLCALGRSAAFFGARLDVAKR